MSFLRTSLVTLVLASTSLLGCEVTEAIEIGESGSLLRRFPNRPRLSNVARATYFVARLDTRDCPSPGCGGVFVSAVNQATTRCAQGSDEPECYVANLDYSTFEGPSEAELDVQDAMGFDRDRTRVVLLGTLHPAILGLGTFRVQMAWMATDTHPIVGQFYGTRVNGIVCIVAPCPSYDQELLNHRVIGQFHGIDLQNVPAHANDSRFTSPALRSPYGMIVAGENIVDDDAGPGGTGIFLKASQAFIPVDVTSGRKPIPDEVDSRVE